MKVQTYLWWTLLTGSLLANLAVRQWHPPPLTVAPPALPDTGSGGSSGSHPPGGPPQPPKAGLSGDVLVLVLQTDLLDKGDAYLKKHLAAFQDRNHVRLLGGAIYLLDSSGHTRAWKADEAPDKGSLAFRANNPGDLKPTFERVVEALEDFHRRAGGQKFETLLVWKSDIDAAGAGTLAGLRKPGGTVMLYWLTVLQPDTKGIDEWLGYPAVTCVDPSGDENLAVDMNLYLDQKKKP
jgi:hypothetical protein